MDKWKIGAIIGGIWGLTSLITLSGGIWFNPLIKYTFGLPMTLAFPVADIWDSHAILFLLAIGIGALIGVGVGYLIDKYKGVK